jgi:hypothetical protein
MDSRSSTSFIDQTGDTTKPRQVESQDVIASTSKSGVDPILTNVQRTEELKRLEDIIADKTNKLAEWSKTKHHRRLIKLRDACRSKPLFRRFEQASLFSLCSYELELARLEKDLHLNIPMNPKILEPLDNVPESLEKFRNVFRDYSKSLAMRIRLIACAYLIIVP